MRGKINKQKLYIRYETFLTVSKNFLLLKVSQKIGPPKILIDNQQTYLFPSNMHELYAEMYLVLAHFKNAKPTSHNCQV